MSMKFAAPGIWREPTNHSSYCYFCLVDPSKRRTGKNVSATRYPDISSSIAPVPHSAELPIPIPSLPPKKISEDDSSNIKNGQGTSYDEDYITSELKQKKPYFPKQHDINNLIKNLGLTKFKAESLTSRLKQ